MVVLKFMEIVSFFNYYYFFFLGGNDSKISAILLSYLQP